MRKNKTKKLLSIILCFILFSSCRSPYETSSISSINESTSSEESHGIESYNSSEAESMPSEVDSSIAFEGENALPDMISASETSYGYTEKSQIASDNKTMSYPQFIHITSDEVTSKINQTIEDKIATWVKARFEEYSFEISLMNQKMISIIFRYINIGAPMTYNSKQIRTLNFSTETGELIRFYGYVNTDESFWEMVLDTTHLVDIPDRADKDEMIAIARRNTRVTIDDLNYIDAFSYYTDEKKIGITLSIGHASGDYIIFGITLDELTPYLK